MPFNGSGTFNPAITFVPNTLATAEDQNTQDNDFAQGLSDCLTRDGHFVFFGRTQDFRNLRVGVKAIKPVFAARQRGKNFLMVEGLGKLQVIGVAGHPIKIGEHFIHATVFIVQRLLHLLPRQAIHAIFHPGRHVGQHGQ